MSEAISFPDDTSSLAAQIAAKASAKSSSKKAEEWVLRLSDKESEILSAYCETRSILDPLEKYADVCKTSIIESCQDAFYLKFWVEKKRPSNPHVQSIKKDGDIDCDIVFILQDRFKININGPINDSDYTSEWAKDAAVQALVDAGITLPRTKKFIEQEIECNTTTHFLSLQEMVDGVTGSGRKKINPSAATKSAGHKLMKFMLAKDVSSIEPFTDEELASITYKKVEWMPKAGMLDRVVNYCKSLDDLKAIFKVFQPVVSIRSEQYGINDSDSDKKIRIEQAFKRIVLK